MGSARLPLELQQQIFSFLDPKSFYAARMVCKWWRCASFEFVLSRQLNKLPLLSPDKRSSGKPVDSFEVWKEAAYTLMLGMNVQREPDSHSDRHIPGHSSFVTGPRVSSVTNGDFTVTINDRTIALFDTSGELPQTLAQRPLNDQKETVGGGPWLRITPSSYHELALSNDGRILAVAQERTVQIYDLLAEADSFTVNEYISSAAGHYICGLDFEQEDRVLRVRLSGKGAVLYLGTPGASEHSNNPTLQYWRSNAGLRHMFLDSALISFPTTSVNDTASRLSGLQLLRPWREGFLFAAQKHSTNESSHYILGHLSCSTPHNASAPTVEPESVAVLARMETFLSAWDYTLNGTRDGGMGLWENMPSGHEHHPNFELSPDGTMIVLAERDKKVVRPTPLTQLFLYRLPDEGRLVSALHKERARRAQQWPSGTSFVDRLERRGSAAQGVRSSEGGNEAKSIVARLPICLSTVRGTVDKMCFMRRESGVQVLSAVSTEVTRRWALTML
ncbi:hypothetical protein LTR62_008183 [Meristemomyces frigidus]|uniref:F-box domain-containing protein n=1 Tax=Meristemomyces frigidus TaxID=1508187 RepID=A0AAN7T9V4_9PEZI|nr:hypothetical protein LTR62_008183 [Meristemomyces frigidus]